MFQKYNYAGGGPPSSELWIARISGGEMRLLVQRGDTPAWSPDSQRVAYVATNEDGIRAVSVITTDGGNRRTLGPVERTDKPRWSPDGLRIAYESSTKTENAIRVVDVATGGGTVIGNARQPVWIDNARLAFARFAHGSGPHRMSLMVGRLDGTQMHRLDRAFGIGELAYSPRSHLIAYVRTTWSVSDCCQSQINVLRVTGGHPTPLTHAPRDTRFERLWWAVSGKAVLFARRPPQSGE